MSFNALSLAKLGVGFGALAVASIGLLAPSPVDADVPSEYHGGGKSKSVSVDYVSKQWELQELRLGRLETAADREPYRVVETVSPPTAPIEPAPIIPTVLVSADTAQPIALVLESVHPVSVASNIEQQADAVDPKIAASALAQKKRNQAALLLILAEL